MRRINKRIKEFKSLSSDGLYSIPKIEWWLLKHHDNYKTIQEEEAKRFMYLIDGNWVRLPDYIDARTPEEKFLELYVTLNSISEFHREEDYFKQEMAIYKNIKNNFEKVKEWLSKNEGIYLEKYSTFSLDFFGEQDELNNEIHLKVSFKEDRDRTIYVNRNDFEFTIKFTNAFSNIYWALLEELGVLKLN